MNTSAAQAPVQAGWLGLVVGLLVLLPGCTHPGPTLSPEAPFKAGAAVMDITPPIGYRMAGYFDERFSTGTHDPLQAKAIVLQQGREKVALVFCDLLGLSLNVSTNARLRASQVTGIPVSHIVMGATHSHTGPLFDDIRRKFFHNAAVAKLGNDPHERMDYPAFLTDQLVKAIVAAHASLQPAELAAGIGRQEGLTFNRRYWMKNGRVAFNPGRLNRDIVRPAGPSDPDVGMVLLRRPGEAHPFAGLTVFAMHSDTVGGLEYSADYEYFLGKTLCEAFGQNYLSVFGLGTCGDLNHIDVSRLEPLKGFELSQRLGRTLGQCVVTAAPTLPRITHPSLASRSSTIQASLQTVTPTEVASARAMLDKLGDPKTDFAAKVAATKVLDLASRGRTCPMEVQVVRLDRDTAVVCLPAEIFVELGLAIKKGSPFRHTLVLSNCNDRPSYVPTQKAFTEGSYEVTNSRVVSGTGERLVEAALGLLVQLKDACSP